MDLVRRALMSFLTVQTYLQPANPLTEVDIGGELEEGTVRKGQGTWWALQMV
jgi:hypothetical protein